MPKKPTKKPASIGPVMTSDHGHGLPDLNPNARMIVFIPLDGYVEGHGWRVSIVVEGEDGHRPTGVWPYNPRSPLPWFWGEGLPYLEALKLCDEHNERMGISAIDAAAIVGRSMRAAAESRSGAAR